MSSIIQKVNRSRYNLKEILSSEWNTDEIPDLSDQEVNKLYSLTSANLSPLPGVAGACNFSVKHKSLPWFAVQWHPERTEEGLGRALPREWLRKELQRCTTE